MDKILFYTNRKIDGGLAWDASTPWLEEKALKALFKFLDKDMGFYDELKEENYMPERMIFDGVSSVRPADMRDLITQRDWYRRAKKGDMKSLRWLLEHRKHCEYEYWCFVEVKIG